MSLFSRFLVYFGATFLGIGVIIMSFLRRRMINHSRQVKRKQKIQAMIQGQKQNNINPFRR